MLEDRARVQKVPVCVDGRLAASEATGVASYAAAMRAALAATGRAPLVLDDAQRGRFGVRSGAVERARRWLRVWSSRSVTLRQEGDRLFAADVFRLAQARFDRTGRMLALQAPGQAGFMHWTYPIPARIAGWVNLYTVHDVIPLTDPALSPVDGGALRRRIMAVAAAGDRIVTVSSAARQAILAAMPLDPAQVTDCGAAIADMVPDAGSLPAGLTHDEYYLFCGTAEPRKNLPRLIAAWAESGTGRPLVVVGPDATRIAPQPGLIVLPYQPRAALMNLVRQARALLFPSLAEGLGLPVVEAMALGTAMLTSDRGALAETAGGAALLVNPEDRAAIAAAIRRLDRDDALRAALIARGLVRQEDYSLQVFGERLLALHAEFAGDLRVRG
mgnify:CR=1 FL=1